MYQIGKHINGICLNPLEYVLNEDGTVKEFVSKNEAKQFLFDHGGSQEDLDDCVFLIVHPITPKPGGGWWCTGCGSEWSAMVSDNEIPSNCPNCM
jgi:hypothetical protein